MKYKTAIMLLGLAGTLCTQAATTLYYQDFSTDTLASFTPTDDQQILGGSSATLSTDGDYVLQMGHPATTGQIPSSFDINTSETGAQGYDGDYTFTTGTIGFTSGGATYSGTLRLYSNTNVGGEFHSINSVEVYQADNGYVYAEIDYNFMSDPGGTDSFNLTTSFGASTDGALDILTTQGYAGGNVVGADVYTFLIVPEPSSASLLMLGGVTLLSRRKR